MTEENFDDQFVVEAVQSGHTELFRVLVERCQEAVYRMGMSFFKNREDAADFCQDVFLKAFRSLSQFEGKARFSTWLYRIAYNTALNGINRRKEYQSLADYGEIPDHGTPEQSALNGAAMAAVREAVAELPERFKACIDLYFFYGRSYQEIEMITGFPVNTIKSHVFRAKKILQEKLEGLN
jgi:RNA polymerase sigma-70 factor (ECF subfamily)